MGDNSATCRQSLAMMVEYGNEMRATAARLAHALIESGADPAECARAMIEVLQA